MGKIAQLEALHVEYKRYLQTCVDHIIAKRRFNIPRGELWEFFPEEHILLTNMVSACQQHAIGMVRGWAASRYTNQVKRLIGKMFKSGELDEPTKIKLYTIGKYLIDLPSESFTPEVLSQYWDLLLSVGKTPQIGSRVAIQCGVNTATFRASKKVTLTEWWVKVTSLTSHRTIKLPLKSNPYVMKAEDLVKGVQLQKTKRGRWRLTAVERRESPAAPKVDPKAPRIGIDVGLNVIAATSDGRLYGADQKPKFNALKFKVDQLRKNRNRQGLPENSKRLDVLEDRLTGFIKTLTGTVANKLVKSYEGYTFVLEDLNLDGCRGSKRFAYRALAAALGRKAPCLSVNPAYTSQTCPSCGYISRSNRKGTEFHCRGCGRLSHADVIGARNILGRSYDSSISCDDDPPDVKKILQRRHARRKARHARPEGSSSTELGASNRGLTVKGTSPSKEKAAHRPKRA